MANSGTRAAFAEERQRRIAQYVAQRGRAHVAELRELVAVTEPTIRRDLTELERQRILKRTHGGAIALRPLLEPTLASREVTNVEEKDAIAAACMAEIDNGTSIFLDSGSTVLRIAHRLAGLSLNVLTNSIGVAEAVADAPGVRHTVVGGQLRQTGGCFVGPLALAAVERFTVNVAFIGASGLSTEGITEADLAEAELKAAVIARARRVVVPIDHSKVGATDFALITGLDDIDVVVTNRTGEQLAKVCAEHDVELRIAEPMQDQDAA